jgi:hypothetical protein
MLSRNLINLRNMELDEIFMPEDTDRPPPPYWDDALEM